MAVVTVEGFSAVVGGMRRKAQDDFRKVHEILAGAGQIILKTTMPFVPIDKGDLRASGRVEVAVRGISSSAEVVFGGVSPTGRLVDYAVYVHEDVTKGHNPPTCSKFLTLGLRKAMPFVNRWIGTAFVTHGPAVVPIHLLDES